MRKLSVFNYASLNGYFQGLNADTTWHEHDDESAQFSAESLRSGATLIFGRVTYDMMAGFWPTPAASEFMPELAKLMNAADKIVFSRELQTAEWSNTRVISSNLVTAVTQLKDEAGKPLLILGSGSLVTQLTAKGLIDEYQIMIDPVALPAGTPLFRGIKEPLRLKLLSTREFKSGSVLLTYAKA